MTSVPKPSEFKSKQHLGNKLYRCASTKAVSLKKSIQDGGECGHYT